MTLPEGLALCFYGDDFTGSTDTMEALAKAGLRTLLFLQLPRPEQLARYPGLRAVGVAGVSRSLSPAEMDAELPALFTRLRELAAPLFHVKICSTFDSAPERGSIGHTIELGQQVFHSPFVPLVVGAPLLNRFCVFGNLFARSGPESEVFRLDRHPTMTRHPITPMLESDLRLHLAHQTAKRIGLIDVTQLDGPYERLIANVKSLAQTDHEIVLFDTLTESHLAAIGRLLCEQADADAPQFVVGSSGVEYALTAYWREQGLLPPPPNFSTGRAERIAVVSGSCSPVTAQQIVWAAANGFAEIPLDAASLLRQNGDAASLEAPLRGALEALQAGRSVILHTCRGPEDTRFAEVTGCLSQHEAQESGRTLGRILGRLLRTLVERTGIRRAAVTGGDTSGYAAREMGIGALEIVTPLAPGSPLCRVVADSKPLDGLEILFKGGQVGRTDLFGSILKGSA